MTFDPLPASPSTVRYVGFWKRVFASIIDSVLLIVLMVPLSWLAFGHVDYDYIDRDSDPAHFVINTIVPAMIVLIFWMRIQATPGKRVVHARIVDAKTGADPRPGQLLLRYVGYFVSGIVVGLGFLWIAFDAKKQGWHDKIAGTVVVRDDVVAGAATPTA